MPMLRGLEEKQEQDPRLLIRDTRTLGRRILDFFKDSTNTSVSVFVLAAAGFVVPAISDITLLIGAGVFVFSYTRKTSLPFRLPLRSKLPDYERFKVLEQQARDIIAGTNDV